jgi:hypothetical protein
MKKQKTDFSDLYQSWRESLRGERMNDADSEQVYRIIQNHLNEHKLQNIRIERLILFVGGLIAGMIIARLIS